MVLAYKPVDFHVKFDKYGLEEFRDMVSHNYNNLQLAHQGTTAIGPYWMRDMPDDSAIANETPDERIMREQHNATYICFAEGIFAVPGTRIHELRIMRFKYTGKHTVDSLVYLDVVLPRIPGTTHAAVPTRTELRFSAFERRGEKSIVYDDFESVKKSKGNTHESGVVDFSAQCVHDGLVLSRKGVRKRESLTCKCENWLLRECDSCMSGGFSSRLQASHAFPQ